MYVVVIEIVGWRDGFCFSLLLFFFVFFRFCKMLGDEN